MAVIEDENGMIGGNGIELPAIGQTPFLNLIDTHEGRSADPGFFRRLPDLFSKDLQDLRYRSGFFQGNRVAGGPDGVNVGIDESGGDGLSLKIHRFSGRTCPGENFIVGTQGQELVVFNRQG